MHAFIHHNLPACHHLIKNQLLKVKYTFFAQFSQIANFTTADNGAAGAKNEPKFGKAIPGPLREQYKGLIFAGPCSNEGPWWSLLLSSLLLLLRDKSELREIFYGNPQY